METWIGSGALVASHYGYVLEGIPPAAVEGAADVWRQRVANAVGDLGISVLRRLLLEAVARGDALARQSDRLTSWVERAAATEPSTRTQPLSPDEVSKLVRLGILKLRTAHGIQPISTVGGPQRWLFAHPLAREALVQRAKQERVLQDLHRQCVVGLAGEAVSPWRDALLLRHAHQAGDWEIALATLGELRIGDADPVIGSVRLTSLNAWLEASSMAGVSVLTPEQKALVRLARAHAYWSIGDHERASRDLMQLDKEGACAPTQRVAKQVLSAQISLAQGHYPAAKEALAQVGAELRENLPRRTWVTLLASLGRAALLCHEHVAAGEYLDECVTEARRSGAKRLLCRALTLRAEAFQATKATAQARGLQEEAERLAKELGSAALLSHVYFIATETEALGGQWDSALCWAHKASTLNTGRPPLSCYADGNVAMAALALGRYDIAGDALERANAPDVAQQPGRLWLFLQSLSLVLTAHGRDHDGFDQLVVRLTAFVKETQVWLPDCERAGVWTAERWRNVGDVGREAVALEFAQLRPAGAAETG